MSFSELIRFGKRKVDATLLQRTSNLPSELSFQGGNDCCELVWGNGQVIIRNQSSKERKVSSSNNMPAIITKSQDGNEAMNSKSKLSSFDSVLNDFPLSAPQCEMSLDEDDDAVPWLSCPVVSEELFNNVYCSEILPESFGVTPNEFAHSNSTAKLSKLGNNETSSFAQAQNIIPRSSRSSELDCSEIKDPTGTMKLQKNNSGQMNNTAALMNFSYFSRFAVQSGAIVKNTATSNGVDVNDVQTTSNQNKGKVVSSHNQMESTFVNSSAGLPPKSDSALPEHSVVRCKESDGNGLEPAVATSSVCSGNSLERDSNNPPNSLKRKCFEDSEGPSEEAEYESVGIQKNAANRSGSKRSRAAEVHNQSERRRRERINEKMRALQELIPNCNKVDKASMLDEAIEYLKTLQLQVQILSMGTGMYMSQMMLPTAMQHMQRTHMSQFPPMGIGMGPALGFGMGLSDVNSMMQMPFLQNPCFPISSPPTSSPSGFYGGVNSIPMRLPVGNVPGMPLANNSMNQDPNQGSNANEAQIANGLCNIKHRC